MPSSKLKAIAVVLCLAAAGFAAAPARLVVAIKDGKPNPQNLTVASRKTDAIYFQNNDTVAYKIVWTDRNYGSPFLAPGTPGAKGTITLEPFTGLAGPRKVHDQVKSGQKYSYDVMAVRGGKSTRAGSGN